MNIYFSRKVEKQVMKVIAGSSYTIGKPERNFLLVPRMIHVTELKIM